MTDPRNESRCAHGQPSAAAAAIAELRESGEHLAHAGSIAAEAARERLHQLKESAGQRVEQGREKIKGWEETLQGHVSEHPLRSIMIASGIGVVLGLLWRRRSVRPNSNPQP